MVKNIFTVSAILLTGSVLYGQVLLHHPEAYLAPPPGPERYFHSLQQVERDNPSTGLIHYTFDIGTSYTRFGGYGSMTSSYLSPSLQYQLTPRLRLVLGGTIMYSSPAGGCSPDAPGFQSGWSGSPSYEIYISGRYQVSEKLNIDGAVLKYTGDTGFYYPYAVQSDFESYSLGFNYKLSGAFRIGAHIQVSNGILPYMYSNPNFRGISGSRLRYDPLFPEW